MKLLLNAGKIFFDHNILSVEVCMQEGKHGRIEAEIEREQSMVDYDTREFTIEYLVDKYIKNSERGTNEFFVPDYQREFVWDEYRQSKLIESIILGLPIPSMFFAENKDGRCEIVDGSQRVRTLAAFLSDELSLAHLQRLTELNGVRFSELPASRQRKIKNTALKLIFLSDSATEDVKNDLFERINKGSDLLKEMEKRKGILRGKFIDFIYNRCAKNKLFLQLTPICKMMKTRQEGEELILRFFAFFEMYPKYDTQHQGVARLLDSYVIEKNKTLTDDEEEVKYAQFESMLGAIQKVFEFGFAKDEKPQVSRVYFEALSVGAALALAEKGSLNFRRIPSSEILSDTEFYQHMSGKYKTHTQAKINSRIDYIKNIFLGM
ncbi:DUF262 domain-containing protein [Desulfovibrio sp. TomC]|uniref:DUF262 domain-containing protein n=1 Tax=Desulfovibrio sp. TomC TaxID=1562888 RepID=UPI000574D863|nr:DUF262 domain-containing protein [Desulfovibrio sp. TomC]KHK01342.1 hypothetical protein NY78_3324 [Desulfovibrio sp. TomC]